MEPGGKGSRTGSNGKNYILDRRRDIETICQMHQFMHKLAMNIGLRARAVAAALGLVALSAVWQFAAYIKKEGIVLPSPPAAPQSTIQDLPSGMWLEGAPDTSEAFVKRPVHRPNFPNLNVAAQHFLNSINGRWNGDGIIVIIDAKRALGYVGDPASVRLKTAIVRDISGSMIVIDVGSNRFVFLRRAGSLAIAGTSLYLPIELWRE